MIRRMELFLFFCLRPMPQFFLRAILFSFHKTKKVERKIEREVERIVEETVEEHGIQLY